MEVTHKQNQHVEVRTSENIEKCIVSEEWTYENAMFYNVFLFRKSESIVKNSVLKLGLVKTLCFTMFC